MYKNNIERWGFAYFMRTLAAGKAVDYGHMLVMAAAGTCL